MKSLGHDAVLMTQEKGGVRKMQIALRVVANLMEEKYFCLLF